MTVKLKDEGVYDVLIPTEELATLIRKHADYKELPRGDYRMSLVSNSRGRVTLRLRNQEAWAKDILL